MGNIKSALMIKEIAAKLIFQEAIKATAKFLKERKLKVDSTELEVENAISTHLTYVDSWSKEITFNDLKKTKLTSNIYIDVDISLMPRRRMFDYNELKEKIPGKDVFKNIDNHLVILGQPGAGKTTLMKYWCQSIIWDKDFYPEIFRLPILIRLKELNETTSKTDEKNPLTLALLSILGLKVTKEPTHESLSEEEYIRSKETILFSFLNKLNPLIIFDGFDEVVSEKMRINIANNFAKLVFNLSDAITVMTSRSSDYNYSVEGTKVLEICSLDESQIKSFSLKWLEDDNKSIDFLKSLKTSPFYDTAIRPLTVAHLCAIYERVGKIPEKPKTVYKKIVNLLLEEWDEQRGVKRVSSYGNFEIDRKFEFLCRLAFEVSKNYRNSSFTERNLSEVFKKMHSDFSLEMKDANSVINEIESHSGLILQSGYKTFEFAHKSLHEFLCAEHLVKLPSIPEDTSLLSLFPNELAIAVTISSNPSLYFCELVLKRFYKKNFEHQQQILGNRFFATFVNRLVLEKPDFNTSKDVSFALLVLYTMLRRGDSNQLRLFDYDLPLQFEKFVSLILEKNKKFDYLNYYFVDEQNISESKEVIFKLRLKNEKKKPLELPLPGFLFAKESFLNEKHLNH